MDLALTFQVFLVVALSATFIGMGGMISYFGTKRTRMVGGLFSIIGLITAFIWYFMTYMGDETWKPVDMVNNILAVVGAGLGAAAGVALFLVAIIKS